MGSFTYIDRLKEKCNLDDELVDQINNLLYSLINFGYISTFKAKHLARRLYNNIDTVIIEKNSKIDYKSGYYDAIKKELYLKDVKNTEAVYLRLLYALTTLWHDSNTMSVGYSTATALAPDYKTKHENFGINRAILSNLVCRLLYTLPETLSIMPSYRNYQNNFLGYKIDSYNDIYFVEGLLFRQICNTLQIDEENLYLHLFSSNPVKYLEKIFNKTHIDNVDKLLSEFDNMSRKYSNYNKFCYLNKLLNTNYLNMKKHALNDSVEKYKKQDKKIKFAIISSLSKSNNKAQESDTQEDDFEQNIEASLNEKINNLEDEILKSISNVQNILVNNLVLRKNKFDSIEYAYNLKQLEKLLIVKNSKLDDEIYNTIYNEILDDSHDVSTNLIEKIKYSLINETLANNKFQNARKSLSFKRIHDVIDDSNNTEYIAVEIDKSFVELAEIDNLRHDVKDLKNNTKILPINNLQQLLNTNNSNNIMSEEIENIFSNVKKEYDQFRNTELKDMYICGVNDFRLLIIVNNKNVNVIKLENKNDKNVTTLLSLSNSYKIFDNSFIVPEPSSQYLPVLYKDNNFFQKILSFFTNSNT